MKMRAKSAAGILLVGVALLASLPAAGAPRNAAAGGENEMPAGMRAYPSPYYVIYSDLEPERVQEAILRMTRMAEEYHEQLKSNFADFTNSCGREGGAITAACFLSKFTEGLRWAHLDIAGVAYLSGAQKGSTGRPVALLVDFLANHRGS